MLYRTLLVVISVVLAFSLAASAESRAASSSPADGTVIDPLESLVAVDNIDFVVGRAIARKLISGGVVLVGNRSRVLFERAYGRVSPEAESLPVRLDTVFDLASLTKVVATTPAILKLAETGRISLVDRLVTWFPEMGGQGKEDLLVFNLLTHTTGYDDFPLSRDKALGSALDGVAQRALKGEPGRYFRYADINFILLGELVSRASDMPLDEYAAKNIFLPLKMVNTRFLPAPAIMTSCAATLDAEGKPKFGVVQDYTCRLLGGVAGHAGLFSTVGDLSRYCRMLLNGGEIDGVRVLEDRTVMQMTSPYFSVGGKVARGLGWDMASPYSAPKGRGFSEYSFGHTGYSGTSVWIDPARDIYVIFLAVRLDYQNVRAFNQLRNDVSTVAAALYTPSLDLETEADSEKND